jgi:hypothetical protein
MGQQVDQVGIVCIIIFILHGSILLLAVLMMKQMTVHLKKLLAEYQWCSLIAHGFMCFVDDGEWANETSEWVTYSVSSVSP